MRQNVFFKEDVQCCKIVSGDWNLEDVCSEMEETFGGVEFQSKTSKAA